MPSLFHEVPKIFDDINYFIYKNDAAMSALHTFVHFNGTELCFEQGCLQLELSSSSLDVLLIFIK